MTAPSHTYRPTPAAVRLAERKAKAAQGRRNISLFVLAYLLGMVVTLVRALAIAKLWQWFVADEFGVRRLGVADLAGMLVILGFAHYYFTDW